MRANRVVLKSGRLALSTGRPGIYLYTAPDPPTEWSRFNIAAAHNTLVKQRHLTFVSDVPGKSCHKRQTRKSDYETQVRLRCLHTHLLVTLSFLAGGGVNGTTSYTGMTVAQDGTGDAVYVTYDRLGNGWGTVSQGQASAVFAMRLAISA